MRAQQFCVSRGGRCPAKAGGRSSWSVRTATRHAVTSTAGNGIAFRDGQTESGESVGDAGHVPGCAILPKAAICIQQVSGDLGDSASCWPLTETCLSRSRGFLTCSRYLKKRERRGCVDGILYWKEIQSPSVFVQCKLDAPHTRERIESEGRRSGLLVQTIPAALLASSSGLHLLYSGLT